jgi:ribonuclease G
MLFRNVKRFLRIYLPGTRFRVEFYRGRIPLFEKYQVEKDIEKAFQKNVGLKSGGYIVIEQTEGLVSIDVNTGRFRGRDNIEETIYRTNLEAAQEIARQIRLRDLGGIIVIDFIDMEREAHRRNVLRDFREAVRPDRARANILQISELGLVEMTRQRVRPSIESAVHDSCPYCEGKGIVKSATTMSIQTLKRIRRTVFNSKDKTFNVSVHPSVAEHLIKRDFGSLQAIERETKNRLLILADANLHIEDINIEESKT